MKIFIGVYCMMLLIMRYIVLVRLLKIFRRVLVDFLIFFFVFVYEVGYCYFEDYCEEYYWEYFIFGE